MLMTAWLANWGRQDEALLLQAKLVTRHPPPPAHPPECAQENILAESSAMLPDTRQRLEEAFTELQGLVVRLCCCLPISSAAVHHYLADRFT